ncbi:MULTISPECIES: efflux RND transporter permease subunit [unclassified Tolypothrix]|uniref:efflux RND transporter permease subunit n=1 Tax=unclassified Tolypothrix TaxID=2649714 RepID=UPI0005EAB4D6|nr:MULTISPECIES: efflux RND transporter permease subunit [unclassified Tolypothrix]BAY91732.1 acriflavin resistance protein [Microchaete diplosiphon NIES-3275]EKF05137.1 RND transporter [Tolypothrix sp. PCC 7601]MBE9083011.1 efflux RND transporter permease subunit [Tolypothrix sp. LEGE 11397]UYD25747.1 efflux RND transporter permease subunit [Tolypothrix sp. PCC 7712]UYD32012.1 efflux RND transporter permease subunit [Tolypothrix sp. PCC 7601]
MQQVKNGSGFSLSAISIRQHIGTLMLTLAVIVMGVFFIINLPVDLLPSITYPRIGVRVQAPGVSPEVAVDEVTKPLEEAFSATEGVVQVFSQTREGQISIDLFFQPGGNIDQALNDATAAFNRARSTLPDTIEEPRLFKVDPSQLPVYELALTSPSLAGVDLRVFAEEELARELGVVPGVAGVDVSGGVQEEVRINIDLDRLQALGVGLTDVLDELRDRNVDVSGGRILGQNSEPLTRTVGRFQSADEIRNLSFEVGSAPANGTATSSPTTVPQRRVYLRDFAEVIDGSEQQRVYVLLNGEEAVKVSIQKQPDANTIDVVDGVKKRLEELRKSGVIPEGTIFTPTLDESRFIRNSISNVTSSGLVGTALAAIAVLLFLGSLRQTFIIVVAIPLATLAAIILMGIFGLSLNVFSLGGLALGVGIVVDNSIVMLENIAEGAGMTPGKDTKTRLSSQQLISQAEQSSQEVESALIASTSTNLVAVLPFLLIGGFIALLFNELIITISFSVAASILIAVTVVPMLASRMLAWRFSSRLSQFWFLRQFNRRFDAATVGYGRFLSGILRWRLVTVALALLLFGGGSLWMAPQIPQEILPRINTGQANLNAQFPPGTPLETNQKVMNAVNEILRNQPETEYVFTTIGGALFGNTTNANPLRGTSNITLKPGSDVEAYTERVSQEFNKLNLAGIRLRLAPGQVRGLIVNNSPVRGADVDVILQGNNAETLQQAGRQVLAALEEQATLARFRPDADDRQPEIQIRPDWERVAAVGLTAQEIGDTIQTAIEGSIPTQLQRGNRLVDVRVQLNESSVQAPSQLERLPLFVENNRQVRLSDVATIIEAQAPGEVQRINQRQVFLIAGNLSEGASLSNALAQVNTVINSLDLPEGVSILPSAAVESNQQLQSALQLLGGLATFLVFVVMAVQYNSLIDPLVIMFTIPLALAGGIFGLYITKTAIGATVIVGAVLLVGIVVNNAIIMVELANQILEREKVDRKTAILQAAPQRLRPVLMTTITTVLGMFPLALGIGEGSEFLQPLGVVVFSGLSLATLLTLFIIPCFYTLLHDIFSWGWTKPIFMQLRLWKKNFS